MLVLSRSKGEAIIIGDDIIIRIVKVNEQRGVVSFQVEAPSLAHTRNYSYINKDKQSADCTQQ
ncbi:carbon storage regulator [Pseudomonas canadensis]|uniref:carbon storage regulator n=1 Tax=Pseudomonas canadensis TaxID=915099 RepID=UPI003BA3D456